MKKFRLGLIAALFSITLTVGADPGDVFPWGSELPFPWKAIQGTWVSDIDGEQAYIIFKVVRSEPNASRQLRITVIDGHTCSVIANGLGFEDNRVVKAVLTGINHESAKVTVHAFRQADVRPGAKEFRPNSQITIMSVLPISGTQTKRAFELSKVNSEVKIGCP